jgi:hypothetical protein
MSETTTQEAAPKKPKAQEAEYVVHETKHQRDPFLVLRTIVKITPSVCDRCGLDARDSIKDELIDWDAPYDASDPNQDRVPEYDELRPDQKGRLKKLVAQHKRACSQSGQRLTEEDMKRRGTQFTRKRPI